MSELEFEIWYKLLVKEAPKYGFNDEIMEKIGKQPWKNYFNMGYLPTNAICEWSFAATGMV